MDNKEIKKLLIKAVKEFIKHDKEKLWKNDLYEPTFSHRIAVYLEERFDRYNVDCEYNKNLGNKKENIKNIKIRPDIIIHKRDDVNCNKLIIEIKKTNGQSGGVADDIEKLKQCSNLNYDLGVVIGVTKNITDLIFIKSGEINEEISLDNKGHCVRRK